MNLEKTKQLWEVTPTTGVKKVEALLDDYCDNDYEKYLQFLKKLKRLVGECCEDHGVE